MTDWFEVNKDGLRQIAERLIERKNFGIIAAELYQNVMDTEATECIIDIEMISGKQQAHLRVEDNDPNGFIDLSHAYTVFAPSAKKEDPTKSGRFNMGEKVVLAFCLEASIETTSGTIKFTRDGRKDHPRLKRDVGTVFDATIRCTRERYEQLCSYMKTIIFRPGLKVVFNGEEISNEHNKMLHTFEASLKTEIGDELRPTVRKCEVQIWETTNQAMLYELGIPVVPIDDKWHVNVMQKVPLNVDRDNVTPAYLKSIRECVLNEMYDKLEDEDATSTWVQEAASGDNCSDEAFTKVFRSQWGNKAVASTPGNPEADAMASSHGYTVIPSRGISYGFRRNAQKAGILVSSQNQFPTAGKGAYSDDPNAPPVVVISDSELTPNMRSIRQYVTELSGKIMDVNLKVEFVSTNNKFIACYVSGGKLELGKSRFFNPHSEFHFNIKKLDKDFFDNGLTVELNSLIIHEFAHEYESNHLSEKYYDACCDLGAKLIKLALEEPEFFERHRVAC